MKLKILNPSTENLEIIQKKCSRCPNGIAAFNKSRCQKCLDYARNWQKGQTKGRRIKLQCITCGTPTGGPSRCGTCTNNKSKKPG